MAQGSELKIVEPEETGTLSLVEGQGETLKGAAWLATEIKGIIEKNDLARALGGKKKHVELEAWTTVCRINNEAPHAKFVRTFKTESGEEIIEAHAWVTDAHGNVVSEADSFVSNAEKNWQGKPFYARASMAQTRALSKALRLRHSWIMVMAGYEATPVDEMDGIDIKPAKAKPKPMESEPPMVATPIKVVSEPLVVPDHQPVAPKAMSDDPDTVDIIVKTVSHTNGRGICFRVADANGQEIGDEDIWWNTFHKGCFDQLAQSIGQHKVVKIKKTVKGDKTYTNIEEVVG
jgi:hypothetical protein